MSTTSGVQTQQEAALAELIINALDLKVSAETIHPDAPLYGEGLGLDSIDMLEIALAVSQTFGVELRADSKNNHDVFSSLRSLNAFIQSHRGG